MNISYDNIIYNLQRVGGISSYWYELTSRLLDEKNVNVNFFETGNENENIFRCLLPINSNQITKSLRVNLLIERFLKLPSDELIDVFHSSYFRIPSMNHRTKIVSTIHDFTHDLYYSGPRVWLHNSVKKKAILKSDRIITVSENTKEDLLNFYPDLEESKVRVIYNGVSESFKIVPKNEKKNRPFFLYVGSREPYKNFDFAVEIASKYKDFDLVVVGPPFSKKDLEIVNLKLGDRCKLYFKLEVAVLNDLYNNAFCLLYVSSYEGFGIPLLEAMRAGCPFIALNTSSIPEVAGKAGVLMKRLDQEEAGNAVEIIINNRSKLIEIGLEQSNKFSWDSCYSQTLDLYKSLC